MSAAEASFFDGNHCQHVAAHDEARRLERKHQEARQLLDLRARSPMRSMRPQHDAGGLALFATANEPTLF